jgi:hypothetical protein
MPLPAEGNTTVDISADARLHHPGRQKTRAGAINPTVTDNTVSVIKAIIWDLRQPTANGSNQQNRGFACRRLTHRNKSLGDHRRVKVIDNGLPNKSSRSAE